MHRLNIELIDWMMNLNDYTWNDQMGEHAWMIIIMEESKGLSDDPFVVNSKISSFFQSLSLSLLDNK